MKTTLSEQTSVLLDQTWMLTPARMAEHLTKGRFHRYQHVRFLERKLAQAISRGNARLVISMPPRHGKSWLASLFTPAWFLSLWPEKRVVLAAHDSTVAMLWGRSVRDFILNNADELAVHLRGNSASTAWTTEEGGGMVTTGVGGAIPGAGGDLLIVDDPLKNQKDASSERVRKQQIEWFNSTLMSRAEPGASVVVIMTRGHHEDLAGHLERENGGHWEILQIPAIAEEDDALGREVGAALCEERFSRAVLEEIQGRIGMETWNTLYQQRPSIGEATSLRRQWWRFYDHLPGRFDELLMSWDVSFKNTLSSDFVVGQVWGKTGAHKFLVDQVRGRMDFPMTVRALQEFSYRYPGAGKKLIEDKGNGSALVSTLKESVPGLVAVTPTRGKLERLNAVRWQIETGSVYLPNPCKAPWIEEFMTECAAFPKAKHDDQVDAMAYALNELR